MRNAAFATSAFASLACVAILVSGVCGASADAELRFVSEYLSSCLQVSAYNVVPWTMAVAVIASVFSVLFQWQQTHECLRYQALALHALAFHFSLNIACVVEFRTDGTATIQYPIVRSDLFLHESSLHQFCAVQAILDFVCFHLIISADACEASAADHSERELRVYRAVERVYALFAYVFIVCWVVRSMLAAAVFEWLLVLCAAAMQLFGLHRAAHSCDRERPGTRFRIFAGEHSVNLLALYVLLNLLCVLVFAPARVHLGFDAEAYSMQGGAHVVTGLEFWAIVLVSASLVLMSISAFKSDAKWLLFVCPVLILVVAFAL